MSPPGPHGRFPYAIAGIALVIIAGSAAALVYFSGAKIKITPTTTTVPVQDSFTAGPAGDLPFTIVTAKKSATAPVASSGTKQVSTAASGPITIYNAQAKPQTLVANTRFATAAGLIFRIHKGVTVPAGTSAKPGTVVATAYADQPGEMYDIAPASFTVPGLAGTPEAALVYARSTAAMTGGASGTVPVVDPAAEAQAAASLESSMGSDLAASLKAPAGYILLPGAATTTYQELPLASSGTAGQATVTVEAVAEGVAFPETALAGALAASGTTTGAGATLGSGTTLTLAPTSAFPATANDPFSFALSGTAILVAKVDPATIATAVAGKSRSEAQIALANYPEVKSAILILRPFWRGSFPADPSQITVTTEAPDAP